MRAALPYIGCQKAGGTSESLKLLLRQGKDHPDSRPDGLCRFPHRKALLSDFDSGRRVSLLYQKGKDCSYR